MLQKTGRSVPAHMNHVPERVDAANASPIIEAWMNCQGASSRQRLKGRMIDLSEDSSRLLNENINSLHFRPFKTNP